MSISPRIVFYDRAWGTFKAKATVSHQTCMYVKQVDPGILIPISEWDRYPKPWQRRCFSSFDHSTCALSSKPPLSQGIIKSFLIATHSYCLFEIQHYAAALCQGCSRTFCNTCLILICAQLGGYLCSLETNLHSMVLLCATSNILHHLQGFSTRSLHLKFMISKNQNFFASLVPPHQSRRIAPSPGRRAVL